MKYRNIENCLIIAGSFISLSCGVEWPWVLLFAGLFWMRQDN